MKAGRKRTAGRRERNGRPQRPSAADRNPIAACLMQPHRRNAKDPKDPFNESELGRFILRQELPRIVYDSALDYAKLVRRSFAAAGIPQPCTSGYHPIGDGE